MKTISIPLRSYDAVVSKAAYDTTMYRGVVASITPSRYAAGVVNVVASAAHNDLSPRILRGRMTRARKDLVAAGVICSDIVANGDSIRFDILADLTRRA